MAGEGDDLFDEGVLGQRVAEHAPGVAQPGDGGEQHVHRLARQVDDAGVGDLLQDGAQLRREGRVFGEVVAGVAARIQAALQGVGVEAHDAAFLLVRHTLVEIEILFIVFHEGKKHAGEGGGPQVQQEVLVLFRLEEADAVDLHAAERFAVQEAQQARERAADARVQPADGGEEPGQRDGGGDEDVPGGGGGELRAVFGQQPLQEGGAAAEVAQDEERLFQRLAPVGGEEDLIQQEAEPDHQPPKRPDGVEEQQEQKALARQAGVGAAGAEEGLIE